LLQTGGPINTFGYPFAQIGDKTLGWLSPKTFSYPHYLSLMVDAVMGL